MQRRKEKKERTCLSLFSFHIRFTGNLNSLPLASFFLFHLAQNSGKYLNFLKKEEKIKQETKITKVFRSFFFR